MAMDIDIVIATYNNAAVLPATLIAVATQKLTGAHRLRVIMADDGSVDDTVAVANRWAAANNFSVVMLADQHWGVAAARNRGLDAATADIILLLGADIELRPGALAAHIAFHKAQPLVSAAALGWVMWDPRLNPTPLMEYLVHGGPQNNYDALLGKDQADARHFFNGAHLSLKREFLEPLRFSTQFKQYGWEDLDLGRRLTERGLQLYVLPQARALHRHYYSSRRVMLRQVAAGRSLCDYQALHPTVPLLPKRSRYHWLLVKVLSLTGVCYCLLLVRQIIAKQCAAPRLFALTTTLDLWRGIYSSNGHKIA